jgi:hypothetical protein
MKSVWWEKYNGRLLDQPCRWFGKYKFNSVLGTLTVLNASALIHWASQMRGIELLFKKNMRKATAGDLKC